jgi:dTDP-glucose pyrophosphorylase/predicted transcriptional regulator
MFRSENWTSSAITISASLRDAIQNLESSGLHICLIVDEQDSLMGVVTDGDIRRAILKKIDLEVCVSEVMNPNPITAQWDANDTEILNLMRQKGIESVPLVDEKRKVSKLVTTSLQAHHALENTLFVLAGGKGTRLMPLTSKVPKPMLKVDGKPILEHILISANTSGFNKVIISIGYLGEQIVEYFGSGEKFGLEIEYVKEDVPLGTAGPLGLLNERYKENDVVVINGDVITTLSFSRLLEYHKENSADATMVVRRHEVQNQFGVVELSGTRITGIVEKPKYVSHINAGIYVLSPSALSQISGDEYLDMTDLFEALISKKGSLAAFPMHENWIDVGRIDDLKSAQSDLTVIPQLEDV